MQGLKHRKAARHGLISRRRALPCPAMTHEYQVALPKVNLICLTHELPQVRYQLGLFRPDDGIRGLVVQFWLQDRLSQRLIESFQRHGDQPALEIGDKSWTYAEVLAMAEAFAAQHHQQIGADGSIGILPQKAAESYVAVLAAVLMGRPYTSLNMKFPFDRQLHNARESRCRVIVCDAETRDRRDALLAALAGDLADNSGRADNGGRAGTAPAIITPADPADRHAYYMFTSGTTGMPKGVINTRGNLATYLEAIHTHLQLPPGIRASQFFELSFDVSVHDVFYTWYSGGTLCVMQPSDGTDQVGFSQRKRIQSWYSVPSGISFAERTGRLQAGALPDIRWAIFAGEALPTTLAAKWLEVCPNATGHNLYGPTESTITVCGYAFDRQTLAASSEPSVPIGPAYPPNEVVIVRPDGSVAAMGEAGELWIGGPQNALGYVNNPEETARRFVTRAFPGMASTYWYRSGDLVECTPEYGNVFRGRIDDQIKIRGYRAELLEIEEGLRKASGVADSAVVPWPVVMPGNADGIVGFVAGEFNAEDVLAKCAAQLPSYMVPDRLIRVAALPLNSNGKVDRKALREEYLQVAPLVPADGFRDTQDIEASLIAAWSGLFPRQTVTAQTSFLSLHGDSLSYVNALMMAEEVMGEMPTDWHRMTIGELAAVVAPPSSRFLHRVDVPALTRAMAIMVVMLGHLQYLKFNPGSTTPLMMLSGYFFGTMQLDHIHERDFAARLFKPLISVAGAYYILLLPLLYLVDGNVDYTEILLINDVVDPGTDFLWYLHALIHIMISIIVLVPVALMVSRRSQRKIDASLALMGMVIAIGAVFYLLIPLLLPRDQVEYVAGAERWWRYSFLGQLFIFGCGALIASRKSLTTRWVALGLVATGSAMSFYFGYVGPGVANLLSALLLTFLTTARMPRLAARMTYAIANASLFLYLFQPPLTDLMQRHGFRRGFVLVFVIAFGLALDWLWNRLPPIVRLWRDRRRARRQGLVRTGGTQTAQA